MSLSLLEHYKHEIINKRIVMKLKLMLITFAMMSSSAGESFYNHLDNYEVPKEFYNTVDFHPLGYLETFPVENEIKILDRNLKNQLACLFINASQSILKKYKQDYLMSTEIPIYKLLKFNYPSIVILEKKRSHIFLEKISGELIKKVKNCHTK